MTYLSDYHVPMLWETKAVKVFILFHTSLIFTTIYVGFLYIHVRSLQGSPFLRVELNFLKLGENEKVVNVKNS